MFTVIPFTRADKLIQIRGHNDELILYVDYDDVDTEAVEKAIPRLLDALNNPTELANFKGMLAGMVYRWRSGNFMFVPGVHDPAQLCAEELYRFIMESYHP